MVLGLTKWLAYTQSHLTHSNIGCTVADPQNIFGGGGGSNIEYMTEAHQHPLIEHWESLLYISQRLGASLDPPLVRRLECSLK